jgi:hypothetical protein
MHAVIVAEQRADALPIEAILTSNEFGSRF